VGIPQTPLQARRGRKVEREEGIEKGKGSSSPHRVILFPPPDRLQSVLNEGRLMFSARKYDHITPLVRTAAIGIDSSSDHAAVEAQYDRWPRVPRRCGESKEHFDG